MGLEFSVGDTALIYLFSFGLCVSFFIISTRFWKTETIEGDVIRKTNSLGLFFLILSVLSLCVLAGVRGDNVGADTSGYGIQAIRIAHGKTFTVYMKGKPEYSFYGLAYLVSRFTSNECIWLGLVEFLIVSPIFYIIFKESIDLSAIIAVFVFIFKFYNYSLCIMRQSVACSFVLLASYYFIKKRYLKFIILGIIAIGFHATAFIGLSGYFVIASIVNSNIKRGKRYNVLITTMGFLALLIAFLPQMASYFVSLSFIPSYYKKFLVFFDGGSVSKYGLFESLCRILLLIFILLILKRNNNLFLYNMVVAGAVGCIIYVMCDFTWGINTVYRFTEFFDYAFVFCISQIPNCISKKYMNNKSKTMLKLIIAFILLLYWLLVYILMPDALGFQTEHFSLRI